MSTEPNRLASDRLLPTKLFIPPQRQSLLPRPRLIDRLNQRRLGKLTLIAAPAGFGKTTLVTEWLAYLPTGERPLLDSMAVP